VILKLCDSLEGKLDWVDFMNFVCRQINLSWGDSEGMKQSLEAGRMQQTILNKGVDIINQEYGRNKGRNHGQKG
jgi:hypothetical protein